MVLEMSEFYLDDASNDQSFSVCRELSLQMEAVCLCVFLCVSVHMLWSLLHDSVISDLSLSRSVDAVQAEMSCPSLVYVWLRRKASTSDSLKPPHAHMKITNASFS